MLVVVHNRNIQLFLQPLFNFKTLGRRDIFQVYPAKCRFEKFLDLIDEILDLFDTAAAVDEIIDHSAVERPGTIQSVER